MSVTAWRIVKRKFSKDAFQGEGARLFGGRWNSPGVAIVYTAQSQSLAALEMLVHLESAHLLLDEYVLLDVGIEPELIRQLERKTLPKNWRSDPPPQRVRAIGDAWVATGLSAVLCVPSATVPAENNYLLNPRHSDFKKLQLGEPQPFQFDPRLK